MVRVRKLFPEETKPCTVCIVDSLRNEWAAYTKVNDWCRSDTATLVESGLTIDKPIKLPDGSEADLTIGETDADRIVNCDETDHSLSSEYDEGGNRSQAPQGFSERN